MKILHRLGITPNYKGYHVIVLAMELIDEKPTRLSEVMKLYREIGLRQGRDYRSVERCLRTVVTHAWATNREYLQELASRPLEKPPSAGVFLSILYYNGCITNK